MADHVKGIIEQFVAAGQGHVFAAWDQLTAREQASLLADCERVNLDWVVARYEETQQPAAAPPVVEDEPVISLAALADDPALASEAAARGEAALRAGEVAAMVVAGGQGSRLGYAGPKGCYAVGPVSGKTLFAWHAEQIRARAQRYATRIPWYIMTSPSTDAETRRYFRDHGYLGFDPADVFFFQQRQVPSLAADGKLMLAERGRLAVNPDGHGGCLAALLETSALADMQARGIKTISYFQVDNPLVTVADPVFLGLHRGAGAQMSSRILAKRSWDEKVGNVCRVDGRTTVIEYIDMPEELARQAAPANPGGLRFWAGSIAIHMIEVDFIDQMGGSAMLPWHASAKKIPWYDPATGQTVKPETNNGLKFERFIFDALPHTSASVTLECRRETEFAPVKNAAGEDSPETCRQLLSNQFADWLEAAGVSVPRQEGNAAVAIEISPLHALDGAELQGKLNGLSQVTSDLLLPGS